MKKSIICSAIVIALGLLIALGPQFLFKVCGHGASADIEDDCCDSPTDASVEGGCGCSGESVSYSVCHWTARAEIGMGILIAALGICFIVFPDRKTQMGLSIGIFMAGIIALSIPHALIGGCSTMTMACRRIAFPALTVESIILILFSAVVMVYLEMKNR